MYTYTHVTPTHPHTHTHTCILYTCIHVLLYTHTRIYIYIQYTYTHTHIYIYTVYTYYILWFTFVQRFHLILDVEANPGSQIFFPEGLDPLPRQHHVVAGVSVVPFQAAIRDGTYLRFGLRCLWLFIGFFFIEITGESFPQLIFSTIFGKSFEFPVDFRCGFGSLNCRRLLLNQSPDPPVIRVWPSMIEIVKATNSEGGFSTGPNVAQPIPSGNQTWQWKIRSVKFDDFLNFHLVLDFPSQPRLRSFHDAAIFPKHISTKYVHYISCFGDFASMLATYFLMISRWRMLTSKNNPIVSNVVNHGKPNAMFTIPKSSP